ncbi:hypothetical protein BJX66DRAFT_341224 [Aspergillus keveii]|uniref:Uncharacterized protein n=1 Tax=Aspergillus keveii TaxID=714993 RepID=A0ABR4FVW6_9EURO
MSGVNLITLALLPFVALACSQEVLAENETLPRVGISTTWGTGTTQDIPYGECTKIRSELWHILGQVKISCPKDEQKQNICTFYTDDHCKDEIITFTRPHQRLDMYDENHPYAVGNIASTVKCEAAVFDLSKYRLERDWPPTKTPAPCTGDRCNNQAACVHSPLNRNIYCSSRQTCQPTVSLGEACTEVENDYNCQRGYCNRRTKVCKAPGPLGRCRTGIKCPTRSSCRPGTQIDAPQGDRSITRVCLKDEDPVGKPCSEHTQCGNGGKYNCNVDFEGRWYCGRNWDCKGTGVGCVRARQCCSGWCSYGWDSWTCEDREGSFEQGDL